MKEGWKYLPSVYIYFVGFVIVSSNWISNGLKTVTKRSVWYLFICRCTSVTSFIEFILRTRANVIFLRGGTLRAARCEGSIKAYYSSQGVVLMDRL